MRGRKWSQNHKLRPQEGLPVLRGSPQGRRPALLRVGKGYQRDRVGYKLARQDGGLCLEQETGERSRASPFSPGLSPPVWKWDWCKTWGLPVTMLCLL